MSRRTRRRRRASTRRPASRRRCRARRRRRRRSTRGVRAEGRTAGGARRYGPEAVTPALLPKPAAEGPEDDLHLSLRDHLLELRQRLKWAVIWLLLGFGAS